MSEPATAVDLVGDDYTRCPARHWARWRQQPIFRDEQTRAWIISRAEDIETVLGDEDTYVGTLAPIYPLDADAARILGEVGNLPVATPAPASTHGRYRAAFRETLPSTAKQIAEVEPQIRKRVEQHVQAMLADPARRADLVPAVAWPTPLTVLADLLGLPETDHADVKRWAASRVALHWGRPHPENQRRAAADTKQLWDYCLAITAASRRGAADSVLARLLRWQDGDLTHRERASFAMTLLVAGHETTGHAIAHAVYHLLAGGHWPEVAAGQIEISRAVDEALRYEPSFAGWHRLATTDTTLSGASIKAGDRLLLLLGSGNRDERRFADPERFDPRRGDARRHIAFGHGSHYCVGWRLAVTQVRVVLETLAAAAPDLALDGGNAIRWRPNASLRAPECLPVRW